MAYAIPLDIQGAPRWQVIADRRLKLSMVLAALMVAGILSMFRLPVAGEPSPLVELVVSLIERAVEPPEIIPAAPDTVTPVEPLETVPDEAAPTVQETVLPDLEPAAEASEPVQVVPEPRQLISVIPELLNNTEIPVIEDWREFGTEVVQEFIANLPKEYSINPVMDEKRRLAAIKFRPSEAPRKLHAWDNVEKDQIGRTILNLGGGCFSVLDDPSAVYRDVFETYTQYVAQCTITFGKRKPRNLPWVAEIHAKYAYLRRREAQKRDPYAF